MVLVVVAEVEARAERHLPDFRRRDDVAVIVGQRRDDHNLRLRGARRANVWVEEG